MKLTGHLHVHVYSVGYGRLIGMPGMEPFTRYANYRQLHVAYEPCIAWLSHAFTVLRHFFTPSPLSLSISSL